MKILFFRIGAIGDVLLTTPAVRAVREKYPEAQIHYMAGRSAARILKNNPHIDRVIIFNERYFKLFRLLRVILMAPEIIRSLDGYYDLFIDFESSYYSAYISMLVKAGKKIGFLITQKRRKLYNGLYSTRVVYDTPDEYIVNRHAAAAIAAGAQKPQDLRPVLCFSREETMQADKFISSVKIDGSRPSVFVCISGTWPTKRWPLEHWLELIENLSGAYNVFVAWGPGDEKDVAKVISGNFPNTHVLPSVDLRILAAIIAHGKVMISGDNGVRHIANALGLKTIGIFGPTNDRTWALSDRDNAVMVSEIPCRPCDRIKCGDDSCMRNITPGAVLDKLKELTAQR